MKKKQLALMSPATETEEFWRHQKEYLSEIADVHTFDTTGPMSFGDMADLVLTRMVGTFCLAGLSMGGWVSLEIMKRAPERVEKLCLLNTSADGLNPATKPQREQRVAQLKQLKPEQMAQASAAIKKGHIERLIYEGNQDNPGVLEMLNYEGEHRIQAVINNISAALEWDYDYADTLKSITCPTLIIASKHDKVIPLEQVKSTIGTIPNSHIAIIEHAGHASAIEQPEAVNSLMRLWLEYY